MSVYDTREIGKVKIVMLGGPGSGSSTLADLTDTDINSPSNGQVLVYDSTSGKWENGADPTPIATTSVAGKVKPDGTTISVANDGTISSTNGMPENPLGTAHGGTGNADGYIRTGLASGVTAGTMSTAEGYATRPTGDYAHAEGYAAWATGDYSHCEGSNCQSGGNCSHAGGLGVQASYDNQTAIGKFNDNKSTTLFEVGNGTGTYVRSNALEVYSNGNVVAGGTITDGSGNSIPSIATTSVAGKVKPDGSTITVDANGVISSVDQTPIATTSVAGKVKPDGTTITVDNDGTIHGTSGSYNDLSDKPQINSVTLTGNKSLSDLSIASVSDLAAKADNAIIADTFSSAAEYYTGDIVIYNGELYKFRSYHSGNWSGTDVDAVTVESLLGSGGLPEDPLGVAHGGTGNSAGYIRVGALSGTTVGTYTTAEGDSNTATASYAHAEGYQNTLTGNYAHVEGNGNEASANYTHAEGQSTTASKANAHAEGYGTTASGTSSHAEGQSTTASGSYSHAEGYATTASNSWAHAEGGNTSAGGQYSHSEGTNTSASGYASHAGGGNTIAGYNYQTTIGKYNDNKSGTLLEVGNGTSSARSNIFEVYSDGKISQDNGTTKFKFGNNGTSDGYYDASDTFHAFGSGGGGGGVSDVAWDTTNKKLTKTIGSTTSDIVTGATILDGLTSSQVTTALGYTPPQQDTNTHRPIKVNGNQVLGNNTTALNLVAGTNVTLSESGGAVTISASGGSGSGNTKSKTRYSISYGSWSSSKNSDGFYTYSLTLSPTLATSYAPTVSIAGSSDTSQPTATHRRMYKMLARVNLSASNTLVLYASVKPTSTFYIFVDGVDA